MKYGCKNALLLHILRHCSNLFMALGNTFGLEVECKSKKSAIQVRHECMLILQDQRQHKISPEGCQTTKY